MYTRVIAACAAICILVYSGFAALAQTAGGGSSIVPANNSGKPQVYSLENDPVSQNILFLQIIDTANIDVPAYVPVVAPLKRQPLNKNWDEVGKKLMKGFIVDKTSSLQRTPLGHCDIYVTKDGSIFKIYQYGIEWAYGLGSMKKAIMYDFEEIKRRNEKPSSKPLPPPVIRFISAAEGKKIALDYVQSTLGYVPKSTSSAVVTQEEEFETSNDKLYTLKIYKAIPIKRTQHKIVSSKMPTSDINIMMVDDYIEVKVDGNKRVVSATIKWFEGDTAMSASESGLNGLEAINAARKAAIAAYNNNPPTFTLNQIQLAYVTVREDLTVAYPVWLMDLRYNEAKSIDWKPTGNQTVDALSHKYGTKVDTISLAYGIDAISGKPFQL